MIPPHYKSQPTASPFYQQILLEARDLQHSLNQYNDKESLPPTIFTSCHNKGLPMVIDTGASMSITPELSDFAITPIPSTTKSLGSLTTAKTTVSGECKATPSYITINNSRGRRESRSGNNCCTVLID